MMPSDCVPPRVLVLGSINMDLVARVPAIPRAGETLTGRSLEYVPGGKGANQAVAAARLGADVRMCGRLGDDACSSTLREGLLSAGVDASLVLTTPNCASGVAWISVDDSGRNAITVIPGSNGRVTPADVRAWEPAIQATDLLLLQLEVPLDAVAAAVSMARRHGVRIVLDVAPVPGEPLPEELWTVDLLSPNQVEAEQLVGFPVESVESASEAARVLLDRGPQAVVIKLGALGAFAIDRSGLAAHVPALRIAPVDTTAAGDAFTAALGIAWAGGESLLEAVRWGCGAGAAAAMKPGAQPSMPTRAEIDRCFAGG